MHLKMFAQDIRIQLSHLQSAVNLDVRQKRELIYVSSWMSQSYLLIK